MHLPTTTRYPRQRSVALAMLGATALLLASLSGARVMAAGEASPAGTVTDGDMTTDLAVSWVGQATSFTGRGDDAYAIGYLVLDGDVVTESSLLAEGDGSVSDLELDITAEGEGFSAVIARGEDTDVTLTGSIVATDDGDGSNASDFSGLGALIVASDGATVTVDSMDLTTEGFVRAAFIADDQADIIVTDSTVTTLGADPLVDIYTDYENNADTARMISPPWVLGIQGGVRAGNMLGQQPSLSVVDSDVTSGSWAVLSTDSSSQPQMTVVDSALTILTEAEGGMTSGDFPYSDDYGSGYGTYLIGNANQDFYGVTFEGMTYAAIFAGGEATYSLSLIHI